MSEARVPSRAAAPVVAVVPVKPLHRAKSRLLLDDDERADLALAFAADTAAALTASQLVAAVLVVTADGAVEHDLREQGAHVVADTGVDLPGAVRLGVDAARSAHPGLGVLVVPGDLPCLRSEDVSLVLGAAAGTRGAFVPDRDATGTTLLVLPPGLEVDTRYGPHSAQEHLALGLVPLVDAPPTARHDVDTLDDLRSAAALGLGPRTRAALRSLDLDGDLELAAS